jgi:hypothetical protein
VQLQQLSSSVGSGDEHWLSAWQSISNRRLPPMGPGGAGGAEGGGGVGGGGEGAEAPKTVSVGPRLARSAVQVRGDESCGGGGAPCRWGAGRAEPPWPPLTIPPLGRH